VLTKSRAGSSLSHGDINLQAAHDDDSEDEFPIDPTEIIDHPFLIPTTSHRLKKPTSDLAFRTSETILLAAKSCKSPREANRVLKT
jgi:hypothetical protein